MLLEWFVDGRTGHSAEGSAKLSHGVGMAIQG